MNMSPFIKNENEKPLDNIVSNGGMFSIFRKFACIGDSLASGEFESLSEEGIHGWHDMFEYSWGQFMARDSGSFAYNFSRGGMTAKEYLTSWANENGCFDEEKACPCYIIALGANDISSCIRGELEMGEISDVNVGSGRTKDNFVCLYADIIRTYKTIEPRAKFFLVTMPRGTEDKERAALEDKHSELMYGLCDVFKNTYVIDLRKYAPVYDDNFKKQFFLGGHLNPMGYRFTATMFESYIDYIIRQNPDDFKQVPFYNSKFHYHGEKW